MVLSILIPLYNEEEFVGHLLKRVIEAPLPEGVGREIIVVDDGSRDASIEVVKDICGRHPNLIRLICHEKNQGKGAAIRTAIAHATGDFCIIQDADLEYDPNEYSNLLVPLLEGRADAVFGSRFVVAGERRVLYYWHSLANHLLTSAANIVADLNLTDMETCYKAVRTQLLQSIPLRSERFGIEPELTIKLAQRQARIYEVPISYHGRTYAEGKKIGLSDAFEAIFTIARFALIKDIYTHSGGHTLDALNAAPRFNRWMAESIRPYVGRRVLELGAGIGNLTQLLLPRRQHYIATDIDREYLVRLESRFANRPTLEVRQCDLGNPDHFRELERSVDSVICINVLEHVENDSLALDNMYRALDQGGRAIVLVPQDQRIFGSLDTALGHYRRYTAAELQQRMERAGFHMEGVREFNRISRYPWWFSGQVLKRETLSVSQMKIFDKFVWLWRRLDPVLPWPAVSIIGIGTKR